MTYILDSLVVAGEISVAALCRRLISKSWSANHIAMKVEKVPVALLVRRRGQLSVIGPSGESMALREVELLCPGAISKFEAMC